MTILLLTNNEKPQLIKAIAAAGDPHHLEPSSDEVKKMLKANVLLAAPSALHPWSRAIVDMRKDKNSTLEFMTPTNHKMKEASDEALAHFWLYPKIHCDYWLQLHQFLKVKSMPPSCPYQDLEEKLRQAAKKINQPIILSHDALVPLFRSFGIDAHAIRGSGHHEEPRPSQLKQLQKLLDHHQEVIWIVESRIHFPQSIEKMQRPKDRRLDLDTSGDFPQIGLTPLQRLQLLFAKL
jgi:ABC-type Zn uptake system ZnuABC Zn-binding protein ZnuA